MTTENLISTIQNLGVPVAILVWLFWRADFFLRFLLKKLDKFNDELNNINLSLRDLFTLLKK